MKKMNQKIVFTALLILVLCFVIQKSVEAVETESKISKREKIIVGGDFDYKPYTFIDADGIAKGYDVDIIKSIAEKYNLELEFRFTPWNQALENLITGEVDVLLGIFYTEQRELSYYFTIPHSVEYYGIFVRNNSQINGLDDLWDKKIVALEGDASIDNFIKPMGLQENLSLVNSLPNAIEILSKGKYDVVLSPYSIGMETITELNIKNITVVGPPILPSLYRFAVKKGNSELLSILNDGIDNIKATGELEELRNKWHFHNRKEVSVIKVLRYTGIIATPILLALLLLIIWSRSLRRKVNIETKSLQETTLLLQDLNATKDKLFSIIAHDLKGPFSSILGLSNLLSQNIRSYDITKSEEFIKNISLSAQNTLNLLENLLNWAQTQTGQMTYRPEIIKVNDAIRHAIGLARSSAIIKNISLIHVQSDDLDVCADQNMLTAILRNLITNAIKFTKANGKVEISSAINKDFIEISVSDNGVGMCKATQENLFKINSTNSSVGTENEKGTGLGLIVCKEFIEMHGGSIWVESETGKGSRFTFSIPKHN
jgi:signal transduction histidine kinase